jgi:hypothetical protein
MVQGQLHALGGKQHLKSKFGSEFEIIVKLASLTDTNSTNTKDLTSHIEHIREFLQTLGFTSAALVYENGGLLTFQVSKQEIQQRMGLLFTELETNKDKLCIESYSIAQPTLEQVKLQKCCLFLSQC